MNAAAYFDKNRLITYYFKLGQKVHKRVQTEVAVMVFIQYGKHHFHRAATMHHIYTETKYSEVPFFFTN